MISPSELNNRAVQSDPMTERQREAFALLRQYYALSNELPSTGWLSRRLNISRQRAHAIMESLRPVDTLSTSQRS